MFGSGDLNEEYVENMDERHLVYDLDNRSMLAKRGSAVNYKEVVSGSKGMTIAFRLIGGPNAQLADPFFIFQNARGSFPIRGVPDNLPHCTYRSQKS